MFTTTLANGTRVEEALAAALEGEPCGRCSAICEPKDRVTFNLTTWQGHHYQQQYHADCAFSYFGYRGK